MSSEFKIINTNYIDEISLKAEFQMKILVLFKQNVFEYEKMMNIALEERNYVALAELAHKAKSSVKILGMDKQADDMKLLQLDIEGGNNPDTYEQRVVVFIESCHAALKEVSLLEKELIE